MVSELLNPWIRDLVPYSSARSEFSGSAGVFLDANESWTGRSCRYPDPLCRELRLRIESAMGLPFDSTAIGNGSDEIIDMLIRMFCSPGHDRIMIERPTYGTYSVFASVSGVSVIDVPLTPSLDLDTQSMLSAIEKDKPKIVFICSPNNPTGRIYPLSVIRKIAEVNKGMTVVDEAYADFSEGFASAVSLIAENERVAVLRTLSKAYAAAGARIGILVSSRAVQEAFMRAKPPYNVSGPDQEAAMEALSDIEGVRSRIAETIARRKEFSAYLSGLPFVREVFPSEANFILMRVTGARSLYDYLVGKGIIVRLRSSEPLLENTIRITIGSESEMTALKEALDVWEG